MQEYRATYEITSTEAFQGITLQNYIGETKTSIRLEAENEEDAIFKAKGLEEEIVKGNIVSARLDSVKLI